LIKLFPSKPAGFFILLSLASLSASGGTADPPAGPAWTFSDQTAAKGLSYTHSYDTVTFPTEDVHIAGGLGIGDLNGDGWDDIYVVTGYVEPNTNPNKLFIANGDGTFSEAAAAWNLGTDDRHSSGPLIVDVDGDGRNDLVVGGMNNVKIKLYRNTGSSTFSDVTVDSQLRALLNASTNFGFAAGDYDGDGDLDLFVTHWINSSTTFLLQNNGSGVFADVTMAALGAGPLRFTFTPGFADIDDDGLPDLLVAGDFLNATSLGGGSHYFINNGDGTFTPQGHPVPVAPGPNPDPYAGPDENGMGSAIADYDNDGDLDWFVSSIYDTDGVSESNWGVTGNRLYQNDGAGGFTDVTDAAGVRNGFWGWGSCFADFNNDMHLDLFHVNGFRSNIVGEDEFENDPARMFISNGDGTFTDQAASLGVADTPYGRAILCFDNDRDGDLDILINNNNSAARFFNNNLNNGNHYIEIKLKQDAPNADAIGAEISLTAGGVTQLRVVYAGANFESSHPTAQHFGLGPNTSITSMTVTWPDGGQDTWTDVAADQYLVLIRASDKLFGDNFE